jgi:hypothetical protein
MKFKRLEANILGLEFALSVVVESAAKLCQPVVIIKVDGSETWTVCGIEAYHIVAFGVDGFAWSEPRITNTTGVGIDLNYAFVLHRTWRGGSESHEREGEGGEGFNAKDHIL